MFAARTGDPRQPPDLRIQGVFPQTIVLVTLVFTLLS